MSKEQVSSFLSPYRDIYDFYEVELEDKKFYIPAFGFQDNTKLIATHTPEDAIYFNCIRILRNPQRFGEGLLSQHALKYIKESGLAIIDEKTLWNSSDKLLSFDKLLNRYGLKFFMSIFPKDIYIRMGLDMAFLEDFLTKPGEWEYKIEDEIGHSLPNGSKNKGVLNKLESIIKKYLKKDSFLHQIRNVVWGWFMRELFPQLVQILSNRKLFLKLGYGSTDLAKFYFSNQFKNLHNYLTDDVRERQIYPEEEIKIFGEGFRDAYGLESDEKLNIEVLATETLRQKLIEKQNLFGRRKNVIFYRDADKIRNKFIYSICLRNRQGAPDNVRNWWPTKWVYLWSNCMRSIPFCLINTVFGCFKIINHRPVNYVKLPNYYAFFNFEVEYEWCSLPGYLWGFGNDISGMNIFGELVSKSIVEDANQWILDNRLSVQNPYMYDVEYFNEHYAERLFMMQRAVHDEFSGWKEWSPKYIFEESYKFNPGRHEPEPNKHNLLLGSAVRNMAKNATSRPWSREPNVIFTFHTKKTDFQIPYQQEKLKIGGKRLCLYWNPIKPAYDLKDEFLVHCDLQPIWYLRDWADEYMSITLDRGLCDNITNNLDKFKSLPQAYDWINNNPGILESSCNSVEQFLVKYINFNFRSRWQHWIMHYGPSAERDEVHKTTKYKGPETGQGGYYTFNLEWRHNPFYTVNAKIVGDCDYFECKPSQPEEEVISL